MDCLRTGARDLLLRHLVDDRGLPLTAAARMLDMAEQQRRNAYLRCHPRKCLEVPECERSRLPELTAAQNEILRAAFLLLLETGQAVPAEAIRPGGMASIHNGR